LTDLSIASSSVISVPSFQKDFGHLFKNKYIISASWQITFNTASSTGGLFGALAPGYLADNGGMSLTLGLGCILSIGAVLMQVFAAQPRVLLAGKVYCSLYSSINFN
jgi:SP family general alpha glucoside:H+ symporter-like MFS transporter